MIMIHPDRFWFSTLRTYLCIKDQHMYILQKYVYCCWLDYDMFLPLGMFPVYVEISDRKSTKVDGCCLCYPFYKFVYTILLRALGMIRTLAFFVITIILMKRMNIASGVPLCSSIFGASAFISTIGWFCWYFCVTDDWKREAKRNAGS